jgi:hypothetical protein
MNQVLQKTTRFEVVSRDGEHVHVRMTLTIDAIHDHPRTTYTALLRRTQRAVTPLGGNRFRIGGKEFKRLG